MKALVKTLSAIILVIVGLIGMGILVVAVLFSVLDKTNGTIVSSGRERTYFTYVPASYDPGKPTPLVISIHGFAEWPAHQMQISSWNDLADQFGFIVVYPSGSGFPRHWQTSGQAVDSSDPLEDVIFISDLMDELEGNYNIDPTRIYANGLSNGGGMSFLLGCTLSDRISAIGGVSGAYLLPLEECNPSRPVPMIAFHGTADPIVPYQGGPSSSFNIPFPVIPDWMEDRAALNRCDATPMEMLGNGDVSGIRYSSCLQRAEVVFYTIQGGGHAWPGGEPLPAWIVGFTTQDINATQVMWDFFEQFSLTD